MNLRSFVPPKVSKITEAIMPEMVRKTVAKKGSFKPKPAAKPKKNLIMLRPKTLR